MFLIGFLLIIALPFVTRYILEERFYKVEIDEIYNKVYNYSDVYQYIGEITNVGKRNIAGCVFSHQILYDTSKDSGFVKYKHMLLNYVKPKHIYNKDIPMSLNVGESVKISQVMEDYPHRDEPFRTKIECYGKGKAGENDKVLVGYKKPPKEEASEPNPLESATTPSAENAENSEVSDTNATTQDSNASQNANINANAPNATFESTQESTQTLQTPQDSNDFSTQDSIESTPQQVEPQTPQIMPPPQMPPQESPQDSIQDNSAELDFQAAEEARKEEERKRREERDNFRVPMLKEAPR